MAKYFGIYLILALYVIRSGGVLKNAKICSVSREKKKIKPVYSKSSFQYSFVTFFPPRLKNFLQATKIGKSIVIKFYFILFKKMTKTM